MGWRGVVVVWPKTAIPRCLTPRTAVTHFVVGRRLFPHGRVWGRDDRHFGSVLGKEFRPVIPPLQFTARFVGGRRPYQQEQIPQDRITSCPDKTAFFLQ
ncbi:MAG: hypothetical protein GY796_29515 [Chloroflexi bacterium]|nr:hypothetical protein [Chloroflexota bacterium]